MQSFKTVDEYLKAVPEQQRKTLEKLRQSIKAAAPKAEEVISYGIPMYKQNGFLGGFGAFKSHCSYFPTSGQLIKTMAAELKSYKVSKGTIQFPIDKPLPAALVKKMIRARIRENEMAISAKSELKRDKDGQKVKAFMKALKHPLKKEIEAVRSIIRKSNTKISERIKWNAPSYYASEDLVTFNPRDEGRVHLVFHHPAIVKIKSSLLEGNYKDRRMMYFTDMNEVKKKKKELERIMSELVAIAAR
jgi:uncharacterized protein YdhG (YjbR/CyaY superfamily)